MDIKDKKSGLETYISILNMDKTENQLYLKNTKELLVNTNKDILETKNLINSLDDKIREISSIGGNFPIGAYELLRRNIDTAIENEERLIKSEKELSVEYDVQLQKLHKKLKSIDICNEKQKEYTMLIQQYQDKKLSSELDELCGQRKWILENND